MKWDAFFRDIKEKVGLSPSQPSTPISGAVGPPLRRSASDEWADAIAALAAASAAREEEIVALRDKYYPPDPPPDGPVQRETQELEADFKRAWDCFLASASQKEKDEALTITVDIFCRLVKRKVNAVQLLTTLEETRVFSYVAARALVTDVEKLRISNKEKSTFAGKVMMFFLEINNDGISPGSNLLSAVQVLSFEPIDKQPLFSSGLLCCFIRIFDALVNINDANVSHISMEVEELASSTTACSEITVLTEHLEVKETIVHATKALASHPLAARSLLEDDSLELLFRMISTGSLVAFSQFKEGMIPLHSIQLLRHAMQILGLLLLNDNGSTANYIHKHSLIKVLLMAVKDFDPKSGDSEYAVGIVELLLECVELSNRTEAGYIILKEDIHNAHGYQFLVQFALKLSSQTNKTPQPVNLDSSEKFTADASELSFVTLGTENTHICNSNLSALISRLLDVLASLAQTPPLESSTSFGSQSLKSTSNKVGRMIYDAALENGNAKVQDLEAIQMLQDIFLKCDNVEVQAEVVDRMFKIFSSHLDNYELCQPLKMVPLLILNMLDFPPTLQERILKILEYAVAVVNFVPEQELLSLCCLLQQPISSVLRCSLLSFFVKIISFDQQYKRILREIGLLEFLIDNLKEHKLVCNTEEQKKNLSHSKGSSKSFSKRLEDQDIIISSPRLLADDSINLLLFEDGPSVNAAWDCLLSLLKTDKINQLTFHSAGGFATILPFLASDVHRGGALRLLLSLILEDSDQIHPEVLGTLVEILKSGMVGNMMGFEYKLTSDAKCDILGLLWRIFGANSYAKMIFGESTGFSLLFTTLYSFKSDGKISSQLYLPNRMKEFTFLLRAITAAVCNHDINRIKLHSIISSRTFFDLIHESSLICLDWEEQVITLLLELAVEIVRSPSSKLSEAASSSDEHGYHYYGLINYIKSGRGRVYNAGAIGVLLRSLSSFTSKTQLQLLILIEKLASMSNFNQENLTSVGCVGLLLDAINPLLTNPSPVFMYALKTVEVLGAYRLSTPELRLLMRYTLQMKSLTSGYYLVDTMEKLIQMKDTISETLSLAPFVEMDMSRSGHASVQTSLGGRSWPPSSGYSFSCWFQYQPKKVDRKEGVNDTYHLEAYTGESVLQIFSVSSASDNKAVYVEVFLHESGLLTLTTNNSHSLSFSESKFEGGRWNHLAVVHSKPNTLAGLFESSVAYFYLNGKLRHTGKLDYFPSPAGESLQVIIGTPLGRANVSHMSWRLRSCYLFEEALTHSSIYFMYILGRGYRGIFQDKELLKFLPAQACSEDRLAILDGLDAESPSFPRTHKTESGSKRNDNSNELVWSLDKLVKLSSHCVGRKLIFAFDGTSTELFRSSGTLSLLNLVDPESAAASPFGGIPRFGLLYGDSYICHQYAIGNSIRAVGGVIVILALVEASETRDMLHMALTLLASTLHQNPQNMVDMQDCRGYHLLAIFLHRRMPLFDMQSLDIFFQIAACEAFIPESEIFGGHADSSVRSVETSFKYRSLPNFSDENVSGEFPEELDTPTLHKGSVGHLSEPQSVHQSQEHSKFAVLSNVDMIEHVLLDWTLWVSAPISIQLALIGFFEQLVSFQWYRNHNLTLLRKINLVQHLLIVLQRDDLEVQVLEKLVLLLSVILEDGFLASELSLILRFVIMTFDPPETKEPSQNVREAMGKRVIVRNLLLEMLVDLQLTITSEELLEQWYEILSLKFFTYFLDDYVHPTSMTWIMTLLGVCFASSPTFDIEFQSIGGYRTLACVLSSYSDSPDIYYILFCLIFEKPVYPRAPEVLMKHFHSLIQNDGNYGDLKHVELLDSVIAMAKSAFDKLSFSSALIESGDGKKKTVAAEYSHGGEQAPSVDPMIPNKLENGEAAAPATATSILRFMVDLAKICPPFSNICRRAEILESCVDLYFSSVRAICTVKMTTESATDEPEGSCSDSDMGLKPNFVRSVSLQGHKTEIVTTQSVTEGINSPISEGGATVLLNTSLDNNQVETESKDLTKLDGSSAGQIVIPESIIQTSKAPNTIDRIKQSSSSTISTPSPMLVLASWLGSKVNKREAKYQDSSPSILVPTAHEGKASAKQSTSSHDSPTTNKIIDINPNILVEIDRQGNGSLYSSAANAVLDFVSLVFADILSEHVNGCTFVEGILESVPLYIDVDSALAFQGLCLSRLIIFLERRLLQDDEDNDKKLDKGVWSANLGSLSWLIVDHVYMGAILQPTAVLRTLEFLLSMLQMSNKNGCIENALPSGKGLLSLSKGNKQLDAYVRALLKNTNRMVMYCFLPLFLASIGENEFLSCLGFLTQHRKGLLLKTIQADTSIDIATVLQLLYAHKHLVLCRSNLDTDLICCLCVNLIYLIRDKRRTIENFAVDILKYMLLYRRAALEELLSANSYQGQYLNVLDGGFDKLITRNSSAFFEWFSASKEIIDKALEQCAALMWTQYISGSSKFLIVRKKGMEGRLDKKRAVRSQEASNSYSRHQELTKENRKELKIICDSMSTKLRVIRQNKYGWILHAESEWQNHLQHLVHERGIIPMGNFDLKIEWKISPIEGPYRMRKKLERCNSRVDKLEVYLKANSEVTDKSIAEEKRENASINCRSNSDPLLKPPFSGTNKGERDGGESGEDSYFEVDDDGGDESTSLQPSWVDDQVSCVDETSPRSTQELGIESSTFSGETYEHIDRSSVKKSPISGVEKGVSDKISADNGEYLIRPYLEPLEKIRHKYNCERISGLDKRDGIFLIGDLCLYVIENFYLDDLGCICEKQSEEELSIIDQALGVKEDITGSSESQSKPPSVWGEAVKALVGGRAWALNGENWDKERGRSNVNLPHPWHMWKVESVHEFLKRDYRLRPVAIEIFSSDGCNNLLVFHKRERDEVFKNLVSMNLPRNNMADATVYRFPKHENNENGRLFKTMANVCTRSWQNGEISNFQYLMHLNTLAGRGYNDLTQYPVFPWVLADYESEILDLENPKTFRKFDKPIGCQTIEGEEEFKNRYELWDDPDIPKFHYGSHYSSAGIVLFYLLRLPPFSTENQRLQGGQFDRADRLFNNIEETWLSAIDKGNTSDVKELIPEFFYLPEFLENRFNLDLGEKQSGEKVNNVVLPPWARGSAREFIRKHREALECDYVSENLHHWIDLIFGYKQRGKAAEEAVNVYYYYTYEGSVDTDSISDSVMKSSILAQINHFGQTPRQVFTKPHVKRRTDVRRPRNPLIHYPDLTPHEIRASSSAISQIIGFHDKVLVAGRNKLLRPVIYNECIVWGFPDCSLRFMSYDQDRILSSHEGLHGGNQIAFAGISLDGMILATGGNDGVVAVWRISNDRPRGRHNLRLLRALCAHTARITQLYVCQPYSVIVTGSEDCSVILWDLTGLTFVKELAVFPEPISAIHVNDLTGDIYTGAGILLAVWSVNGDCLAITNSSQLPSDTILCITTSVFSDWQYTDWFVTGHQSGAVKIWNLVHCSTHEASNSSDNFSDEEARRILQDRVPEYRLVLKTVLKAHKHPVTALHLTSDLRQLISGDSEGKLLSWTLQEEALTTPRPRVGILNLV